MRLIDADKLKRKAQKVGTEAWLMKQNAPIETTLNQFIDWIENAPTIEQSTWIPCSEKLPEADGLYLATFTLIGIPKFSNVESFKNGKWEYHNGYIIAWQPLPEPWKGADDE